MVCSVVSIESSKQEEPRKIRRTKFRYGTQSIEQHKGHIRASRIVKCLTKHHTIRNARGSNSLGTKSNSRFYGVKNRHDEGQVIRCADAIRHSYVGRTYRGPIRAIMRTPADDSHGFISMFSKAVNFLSLKMEFSVFVQMSHVKLHIHIYTFISLFQNVSHSLGNLKYDSYINKFNMSDIS